MSRRTAWFVAAGVAVTLVLAFGVSRYASTEPDGLERVAADRALDTGEEPHPLADSPFADYATRGVGDPGLATGLAGVVGVATCFALAGGLVWLATATARRRPAPDADRAPT